MEENKRPLIFISNDDGYQAGGLKYLAEIARQYGDIFIAAPSTHQSGKSSALTVEIPLRAKLVANDCEGGHMTFYHVSGTPADCIKLAVNNPRHRTFGYKPRLQLGQQCNLFRHNGCGI